MIGFVDDLCCLLQKIVEKSIKEKWNVWSLQGGLDTLTESLSSRLQSDGVEIKKQSIPDFDSNGNSNGSDFTIWSTPTFVSATYISDPDVKNLLLSVPYVDVAVINIMFERKDLIPDPGFGFLIPSTEKNVPILGVIYDTCSFPQVNIQLK